jgi:hypothetical protein
MRARMRGGHLGFSAAMLKKNILILKKKKKSK